MGLILNAGKRFSLLFVAIFVFLVLFPEPLSLKCFHIDWSEIRLMLSFAIFNRFSSISFSVERERVSQNSLYAVSTHFSISLCVHIAVCGLRVSAQIDSIDICMQTA